MRTVPVLLCTERCSLTLLCLPLFQVLEIAAADLSACLGFGMVEMGLEDVYSRSSNVFFSFLKDVL